MQRAFKYAPYKYAPLGKLLLSGLFLNQKVRTETAWVFAAENQKMRKPLSTHLLAHELNPALHDTPHNTLICSNAHFLHSTLCF